MFNVLLTLIPLILIIGYVWLWIKMLIHAAKRENIVWVLIILFGQGIGAIIYYFVEYNKKTPAKK